MATFNISAGDVNGLVAAIKSANANSEADTINLAAGIYDVSTYTGEDRATDADFFESGILAANAFPVIRSEITINGASAATTLITREGAAFFRLFLVATDGTLRLNDVTLRKGDVGEVDTDGGAVYNKGTFETERSVFTANRSGYGGAIKSDGTAEITDSQISENWGGWGGGINNGGTMMVQTSLISDNESPDGGGIINGGQLTVQNSVVSGNRSIYAGGIGNYAGSSTVTGSTISHNEAGEGGGGLYNRVGNLSVQTSSITNNASNNGKGVLNDDPNTQINAEQNWWGSANGPALGDVVGDVDTANYQVTPPSNTVYWYDRKGAARVASQTSITNFDRFVTSETGNVLNTNNNPCELDREQCTVDGVLRSSVGGRFWYKASDVLSHTSGDVGTNSTGSSIFVSEMVHLGGTVPMLVGADEIAACADNAHPTSDPIQIGWRACVQDAGGYCVADTVTATWRDHESLYGYFSGVMGLLIEASLSIDIFNRGNRLNFTTFAGTVRTGTFADFQAQAYGFFNGTDAETPANLQVIQTGDYIYVNLGADGVSHGFLIVGWGPAVECPSGLNSPLVASVDTSSTEGQYQLRRIPNTVPYVVDFGYAFNAEVDATGWLQDPRPRPFYCSAVIMTAANDSSLSPHLTRLGAESVGEYLAKLRGSYQPYRTRDDDDPALDNKDPVWQFIRLPDVLRAEYGVYSSCT